MVSGATRHRGADRARPAGGCPHAGRHSALVVALAFVMNYRHAKKMEAVLEAYRKDTRIILDEMGAKHAEVTEFYRKNVSLVKNYERMTDLLQTLVINNTRAMEHLSTIIEHRSIS